MRAMAEEDAPNDLIQRLAADPAFRSAGVAAVAAALDPLHYVGRAPEQVDEFLRDVITPILSRLPEAPAAEVRV